MRKCANCDWTSTAADIPGQLVEYADHSTIHNPSPAQWATAYERIQAAKKKTPTR